MPAQTWVFNAFIEADVDGTNDFSSHTFKCALMGTGYSPDIDANEGWADVSANEVGAVTGYTAGGETLANVTITRYDATNKTIVSWDQVRWDLPSGLAGIKGVMVYNDSVAGKTLVAFHEQAAAVTVSSGSAFVASPTVQFGNGGV